MTFVVQETSDPASDQAPPSSKEGDRSLSWRKFSAQVGPVPESAWLPGKHLQSAALFLTEEAEMAVSRGEQSGRL